MGDRGVEGEVGMDVNIGPDTVCAVSQDVVAREIEGELIIVPLAAGVGDLEDELYTLNATARAVWSRLDGTMTLGEIAADLAAEYDSSREEVEADVVGLAQELVRRRIVVAAD
jgi:Coenzyme PQQ synthesis protein D (PqqD)